MLGNGHNYFNVFSLPWCHLSPFHFFFFWEFFIWNLQIIWNFFSNCICILSHLEVKFIEVLTWAWVLGLPHGQHLQSWCRTTNNCLEFGVNIKGVWSNPHVSRFLLGICGLTYQVSSKDKIQCCLLRFLDPLSLCLFH